MSIGRVLSGPAALFVLLCFFLPWVTVSCNNQPVARLSGYQLAAGGEINTGLGSQSFDGDAAVFMPAGAALLSLGLLIGLTTGKMSKAVAGIGQLLLAAAGLAVVWLKWDQLSQNAAANGLEVSAELGLWAAGAGLLALVVAAVLILAEKPPNRYISDDSWDDSYKHSW